jgi:hypothetical protein
MAMVLSIYCTEPPNAVFSSAGADITAIGNIEVDVIDQGNTINAFTLAGEIVATGSVPYISSSVIDSLF